MGLKRKHATGGTNGKAPIGYLNVRQRLEGRDIRTIAVDPDRADHVRMAFGMYATGDYSVTDITEILEAAGLKTVMTRKRPAAPLSRSAVHRMLGDDYYVGIVTYQGAKAPGNHQPLIDELTFERVQTALKGHAASGSRTQIHDHYLKGSVYCGQCGGRLSFVSVVGNGGHYDYFRCFGRHNRRSSCDAPHSRTELVERDIEVRYEERQWLTPKEIETVRLAVGRYARDQLSNAQSEAERAKRRLDGLKAEQQKLLQLAYQELVDDDVLAAEQARIRTERVKAAKWAQAAERNGADIQEVVDDALSLITDPAATYLRATPTERRLLNQAMFEKFFVVRGDVAGAEPSPWVKAIEAVARSSTPGTASQKDSLRHELVRFDSKKNLGRPERDPGLHVDQMVRPRGLEPPRTNQSTRPSTLRVYQFRHRRVRRASISPRVAVRPASAPCP